jgi:Chlorophyllase enzyme
MRVSKVRGSSLGASLAGFVVVLGLGGCSSSGTDKAASTGSADGGVEAGASGKCSSGSRTACTSFTDPTGTTLQLGPYGAIMEPNVGTGFENPLQPAEGDAPDASQTFCEGFAGIFKQSAALTADLLNTNQDGVDLNFALYTVYRPATWPSGPIPVITWGNGTCAQPEGYGALLRYVASYGFFVIAANSREVGSGADMLKALDYTAAATKDSTSPYYGKLDMDRVGAMGHSQGGGATVSVASDSRIKDIIIFNGGDSAVKPYLAFSGDTDITNYTPAIMKSAIDAATVPAAWIFYHMVPDTGNINGHLTLMLQPERVVGPTVAWWKMVFENDPASISQFVGTSCGLCNMASEFEYGEHGLEGGD